MIKNKRGWIRIIEAFIAILLVAGVLIFIVSKGYIGGKDHSEKIYEIENAILYEIQTNDQFREQILNIPSSALPADAPTEIIDYINERLPAYLTCKAKICEMEVVCALDNYPQKDVYASSIAITATLHEFDPRQLKLFCWVR